MNSPIDPFIVLLLAHLIGDFVLQTEKMATQKGFILHWLFLHSLELGGVTWLLCWSWTAWPVVLAVFLTHMIFDWTKARLKGHPVKWYIIDQLGHLLTLWLCAVWMARQPEFEVMPITQWIPMPFFVLASAYLFVGRPLTIGMGLFLRPWQEELLKTNPQDDSGRVTGLTRSGEWIGNLERFFTLTCVLANQFILVGALLLAKSLLRYGELSRTGNRKRVDYVIIGTLGSIGLAVAVGVLARSVL